MRTGRYVSITIVGLFVAATGASADDASSFANPTVDPYIQVDPDGVPLAVTHPQARRLTPIEVEAIRKQQVQAALDRTWLLRYYEQQLQLHPDTNSSEDQDANLYYQLSSNKDLARLAGLPALDPISENSTTGLRTGAVNSGQGAVALRPDGTSSGTGTMTPKRDLLAPLISPLNSPEIASLHNLFSPLPTAMPLPVANDIPGMPPAIKASQPQDSSDIETPGMIAAGESSQTDMDSTDLTLDVLPGESIEDAKARQENNAKLELPLPMNAAQLHKEQTASLQVPGAPQTNTDQAAAPVPAKPVVIEDPEAPIPVSKMPQISPVRAPIADPFDILDR